MNQKVNILTYISLIGIIKNNFRNKLFEAYFDTYYTAAHHQGTMEMFWLHLWAKSTPSFRLAEWDIWDQSAIKKQRHKKCLQSLVKSNPISPSLSAWRLMWSGWNVMLESSQQSQTPCECTTQKKWVCKGCDVWTSELSLSELSCGPSLYTDDDLNWGQASWGSLSSWGQIISCRVQILTSETILIVDE